MGLVLHRDFLSQRAEACFLLGISGGRDSVALLKALLEAGFGNLVLCHINHGLRGEASDDDAEFVADLGKQYGLPVEIKQVDVAAAAQDSGQSVELAAREARHSFFQKCGEKYESRKVLLAHHADDQAETILFNLLRGAHGLRGMRVSSEHRLGGEVFVFYRPLLDVRRSEIDAYLKERGISYREDASNAEPVAARNRLRNEAIPLLREIMGRDIAPPIMRAAEGAERMEKFMKETLEGMELEDPQGRLFVPKLQELAPALQVMVLRDFLKKNAVGNLSRDLLESCASLLNDDKISKVNLPEGKFLRRKEKRIFLDN